MKYLTVVMEEKMENKKMLRAPVSQKPHVIEKPEHPEHIGGSVSIEINEKKVRFHLEQLFLKLADRIRFIFQLFVITTIFALQVFVEFALLKLKV